MRVALVALALAACTPARTPYPGDACIDACARRAELGCLEAALASRCVAVCRQAEAARLYDPICVAHADDADGMRACGVRCSQKGSPP